MCNFEKNIGHISHFEPLIHMAEKSRMRIGTSFYVDAFKPYMQDKPTNHPSYIKVKHGSSAMIFRALLDRCCESRRDEAITRKLAVLRLLLFNPL